MLEMPLTGCDHRRAGLIDDVDAVGVLERSAGVNNGGDTGLEQELGRIGKGEKSIGSGDAPFDAITCF